MQAVVRESFQRQSPLTPYPSLSHDEKDESHVYLPFGPKRGEGYTETLNLPDSEKERACGVLRVRIHGLRNKTVASEETARTMQQTALNRWNYVAPRRAP